MKFDPERVMQTLHLRPRPSSEEEKRHGTFNRRMIAASLDSMLITAVIAPVVDYFFIQAHGLPTADIAAIAQHASQQATSSDALRVFLQEMESSGYLARWAANLRWQFYAFAIYTTICWHYWSATPGKIICRLKIVDSKTGGKMGDWQSILRVLGYVISAVPFGLGFFWIGLNKKRRGWHDYLAGTLVVVTPRKQKTVATSTPEAGHPSNSPAPSRAE